MTRALAWRMPHQNAAESPTGPAPITVISGKAAKSASRDGVRLLMVICPYIRWTIGRANKTALSAANIAMSTR
jgi:hypothetical protein